MRMPRFFLQIVSCFFISALIEVTQVSSHRDRLKMGHTVTWYFSFLFRFFKDLRLLNFVFIVGEKSFMGCSSVVGRSHDSNFTGGTTVPLLFVDSFRW